MNDAVLLSALEELRPEALRFLEDLVGINSFTLHPAGVEANADRILQQFAPFGFQVSRFACSEPGTGRHVVLDSGGTGPVIAFVSHMDTVFPEEEEKRNQFGWRPEGNRLYGPGTYDIKGGTVLLWLMLSAALRTNPDLFHSVRWVLLWNAAEEILAPDVGEIAHRLLPPSTRACLVMEGDGGTESGLALVSARKGTGKFTLRVAGRGGHAGNQHAFGANAIRQMARVIEAISALTDYERETTVNVGVVRGGSVDNRIPHEAEAVFEVRYFDAAHYAEVRQKILAWNGEGDVKAAADGFPCRIEIQIDFEVSPWVEKPESLALLRHWREAAQALNETLTVQRRSGLSDANFLASHFPTLDGLGPRGGNAHASERSPEAGKLPEYVDGASFVPKAMVNWIALRNLLAQKN
jgi:glutamate carboxypeptidase